MRFTREGEIILKSFIVNYFSESLNLSIDLFSDERKEDNWRSLFISPVQEKDTPCGNQVPLIRLFVPT